MLEKYRENISKVVRRLRLERRFSQVQLAKLLGLSQSRYCEIERGKGSFTAEQLIFILHRFNVPASSFVSPSASIESQTQKTIASMGAAQLREDPDTLPSEQLYKIQYAIREILVAANSLRTLVSIAPAIVANVKNLNLNYLFFDMEKIGLQNRAGWLIDNVIAALNIELEKNLSHNWMREYTRALEILKNAALPKTTADQREDILDEEISSKKTITEVRGKRSEISKKWNIITRIQPQDFADALRDARDND